MTKAQIAAAIQAIVRLQLDCKRAIKDATKNCSPERARGRNPPTEAPRQTPGSV